MDTTKELVRVVLELSLARQNRRRTLLPELKRLKAANQDTSGLELQDKLSTARVQRLINERKALSARLREEKIAQTRPRFRPSKSLWSW